MAAAATCVVGSLAADTASNAALQKATHADLWPMRNGPIPHATPLRTLVIQGVTGAHWAQADSCGRALHGLRAPAAW